MKKWIRLVLFLLAFQMEVRVRASGDIFEQPAECLKSKELCSIQVGGAGLHLTQDGLKLHADKGAVLSRLSKDKWSYVKGSLWVEESRHISIETLYGVLKSEGGQYWVFEKDDKIWIRNVNSELVVTLRDGKILDVPEGFEFWIAGVNSKGRSDYGMIKPVDMKDHITRWNALYRGTKAEFVKDLEKLRKNWGDLAQKSGLIYETLTRRELASVEARQLEIEKKKQRQAEELRQLKEIYKSRVFDR